MNLGSAVSLRLESESSHPDIRKIACPYEVDDVGAELSAVGMGQGIGTLGILTLDRVSHLVMFVGQETGAASLFDEVQMKMRHATVMVQQAVVEAGQERVPSGRDDGHVKGLVCFGHLQMITVSDSCDKLALPTGDGLQVGLAAQFGGKTGIHPPRRVQRIDISGKALHVDRSHQGEAVRKSDHQLFTGQTDHRH